MIAPGCGGFFIMLFSSSVIVLVVHEFDVRTDEPSAAEDEDVAEDSDEDAAEDSDEDGAPEEE